VSRTVKAFAIVAVLAAASNSAANPVADVPRGKPGVVTVLRPPEAVRYFQNRPRLDAATDTLSLWKDEPPQAPTPECSWNENCGGVGDQLSPTGPKFLSESVQVLLTADSATVTAGYWFEMQEPGPAAMAFPPPECGLVRLDEASYVDPEGRQRSLEVAASGDCWRWVIPKRGEGKFSVHLTYVQRIERDQFIYILGSTERWRRPIGQALFSVTSMNQNALVCNYPLRSKGGATARTYYLTANDFLPDRDFCIEVRSLEGPDGLLYGRVTDDEGRPLSYMSVVLPHLAMGATTDRDGGFRIAEVKPGTHTVAIKDLSHGWAESEVVIFPADSTEIVATLYPVPSSLKKLYR
jgi:Carboxypeptidase regulatory-like domain